MRIVENAFWSKLLETLPETERIKVLEQIESNVVKQDALIGVEADACKGAIFIESGALRAFTLDEEGNELTLLRLKEGDACVLTASCALESIKFDVSLQAVYETKILNLPEYRVKQYASVYPEFALVLQDALLSRFSDVVFLLSAMQAKKMHVRLARELLFWAENGDVVMQTHDQLAKHLNTAREVISRTVRYLEQEQYILAGRGSITIQDRERLEILAFGP